MPNSHIFHEFDTANRSLKENVLAMAGAARQNLERAMRALATRDLDLARMVIGDDTEVDEFEVRIDRIGMEILLRFHPVASDLRFVISSMKMSQNLERISDHAVTIAKRAKKICKSPENVETSIVEPLYVHAAALLRDAVISYTDGNTTLAKSLNAADDELDREHKEIAAILSSRLESSNGSTENLLHLILIARSLERIGDLSVNIGEDTVFLSEAKDIRHQSRIEGNA